MIELERRAFAHESTSGLHCNPIVDREANKIEIKNAVEKMYGVNVERVNTLSVMGKKKVRFTKAGTLAGRKPNYKKAIVTLAEGEVIDFYSNV